MRYLLDTNICIYWMKGVPGVDTKIAEVDPDDIMVSIITIAELLYGAYNSANVDNNLMKVRSFEEVINVLELDKDCIETYARIKAKLKTEGRILDDFDIMIGATALTNNCTLVTNNIKHFDRIDGITIENWIE